MIARITTLLVLLLPILAHGQPRGAETWPWKTETVAFSAAAEGPLEMDLLYPPDSVLTDRAPVHVFIHGGGWHGGGRASFDQPEQVEVFRQLAARGFVGVTIDYRLLRGTYTMDDLVADCKDAIRYLYREQARLGLDAERIAVWGSSAGGHLALMTGLTDDDNFAGAPDLRDQKSAVKAIVSWYGIADLAPIREPHVRRFQNRTPEPPFPSGEAELKRLSPIYYLNINSPPILAIHGENDAIVPIEQSVRLLTKGREHGVQVAFVTALNTGHGWSRESENVVPTSDDLAKITADFIAWQLR